MNADRDPSREAAELRRRAEARLREHETRAGRQPPTAEEALRLVHELQVHQIELEMQNEALRETQAQLEQSLERYTGLYSFAPMGYFTLTGDGTIQELNLAGAALLGQERSRLIGRRFGLFVAAETRPAFNAFLGRALAASSKESCEIALDREGKPPCHLHLEGVGADSGAGCRCRLAAMDITEHKRAEIALRESEARLQRILDGTNDGFWDWNVVTGETLFSGRWAEMLGYELADIEPHVRSWERLVHPADLPHALAAVQAHFSGATPQYQNEHRMRAKNGEWRWILDRGKVSARDAEGRPLQMSGTHTDITDAKIAARALHAALEEKTVLMKEIHHRVKNNLQIVDSLLNLQIGRIDAPEASSALRDMQNRVRSMALLHETLYCSDNLARINLADYLEKLCARLWDAAVPETGHIDLERQIDDVSLPLAQAVPCGLIVNELITNALKHAFPGGRGGRVRLMVKAGADREMLLTVADDGVGLPPGVDPGRANTLGFQLVDMLTHQLRGRLDVATGTGTGTGTAFHVAFPIEDA